MKGQNNKKKLENTKGRTMSNVEGGEKETKTKEKEKEEADCEDDD
jgi:hypothetical protein